jgi:hypothetical protein
MNDMNDSPMTRDRFISEFLARAPEPPTRASANSECAAASGSHKARTKSPKCATEIQSIVVSKRVCQPVTSKGWGD